MYKGDLVLNNLQRLICHKTQTTYQPQAMGKIVLYLQQSKPSWRKKSLNLTQLYAT